MSEDLAFEFVSLTGSTLQCAKEMLLATDYDFQQAIDLYFSTGGDLCGTTNEYVPPKVALSSAQEDYVRTPDKVKRQKLIGPETSIVPEISNFSSHTIIRAPFSGSGELGGHAQKLSRIFAPPLDIMFSGPLSLAKNACKPDRKWLLVDIYNEEEFACSVLNRDIWANASVKVVIQWSFIFVQWNVDSTEGRQFLQLYESGRTVSYPYIAIVDPESGMIIKKITGNITADSFTEKISDFLEKSPNSFSKPSGAPPAATREVVNLADSPKCNGLSERKQESMYSRGDNGSNVISGSNRRGEGGVLGSKKRSFEELTNMEKGLPIKMILALGETMESKDLIESDLNGSFRVQFKLPDSKRVAHTFSKSCSVLQVLHHVLKEIVSYNPEEYIDLFAGFPPISIFTNLLDKQGTGGAPIDRSTGAITAALKRLGVATNVFSGQMITVRLSAC